MAIRFMTTKSGTVHVVGGDGNCSVVTKAMSSGQWKGKRSLKPEQVKEFTDCKTCGSHKLARQQAKQQGKPVDKQQGKRRGPKRNDPNRGETLAKEHAAFAKKHGWGATSKQTATTEWTAYANDKHTKQQARIIYLDGRCVLARVVLEDGREVRLYNSKNWKRQIELAPDKRPGRDGHGTTVRGTSVKSKKAVKNGKVKDVDLAKLLPFDPAKASDEAVLESVVGKSVVWRNGMSGGVESAVVPVRSRNSRITTHPKSGRRMLSFYEQAGRHLAGERTVYVDKILKVIKP